ncbi:MAG: serine/threonine dehydratase [Minwuia thermotolerans]|nr:MAG: serine/threonine dehydratase [Minwuia thermotolerans]
MTLATTETTTEFSLPDIQAAAARIDGIVRRTPLLESARLNDRIGGRLLVKAECLQHTGSFKFRGAYNRLAAMDPKTRARGILAYSSGNHAQGVARAAQMFGVPATIIMPRDAPAMKQRNTAEYGATIVLYDRHGESREEIGRQIAAEQGLTLVKPYDDPLIMAGQGTSGLECAQQCAALGAVPDVALAPTGGGGLMAGFSTAMKAAFPDLQLFAVEPDGYDDMARSLHTGTRVANVATPASICDAIMTPEPGELTFPVNRRTLTGGLTVSDGEVRKAMADAFAELKIVIEPGGCVALAAVLSGRLPVAGRTVVVVASGGNVDPALFADILAQAS